MLAAVGASTLLGAEGRPVVVEVHVSSGLPTFAVVGQPDGTCREARDRVRAALLSSGLPWPTTRITVNLAPPTLRKVGASLDLPIAVGMLVALGAIPPEQIEGRSFLGELGLDGSVRRFSGAVPLVDAIDDAEAVVPESCAAEASLLGRHRIRGVATLLEVVDALRGLAPWPDRSWPVPPEIPEHIPDLADVRGQSAARLALEVAAAGGHHLLLSGPPGAGKTMLARRLPGLLPPLSVEAGSRCCASIQLPVSPFGAPRYPPRHRSALRTTWRPRLRFSVGVLRQCVPASSPAPITASCSSTRWVSSRRLFSMRSVNRWRKGSSGSNGPRRVSSSPPTSSWWVQLIHARAAGPSQKARRCRPGSCRPRAAVRRRSEVDMRADCLVRCWTASISGSPCTVLTSRTSSTQVARSRRRPWRPACVLHARWPQRAVSP